jgi:hypothetical protein
MTPRSSPTTPGHVIKLTRLPGKRRFGSTTRILTFIERIDTYPLRDGLSLKVALKVAAFWTEPGDNGDVYQPEFAGSVSISSPSLLLATGLARAWMSNGRGREISFHTL